MKVLVIEDSERLLRSLGRGLSKAGYAVDLAADGETGLALAESYEYDAIILDLMLPGLSGLEVLRRLRKTGRDTHVLILSAKDRVEDRVKGLEIGADDYLVKPFSFNELCARLLALVRRAHRAKGPRLRAGPLEIDTVGQRVFRGDDEVALTRSEYSLLEFLAYRRGRFSSQQQILDHICRSDKFLSINAAEVLVSSLRKKVHRRDEPPIVRTRRGFGYYIEAEGSGEQ